MQSMIKNNANFAIIHNNMDKCLKTKKFVLIYAYQKNCLKKKEELKMRVNDRHVSFYYENDTDM